MAIPNIRVYTAGRAAEFDDITAVQMSKGRMKVTDNLRAGTAQINGRNPDNIPSVSIGDVIVIDIINPNVSPSQTKTFEYRVADVQIDYGITPALDTWTLDLEDAFAYLGRAVVTRTWAAGANSATVAAAICSDVGITLNTFGTTVAFLSGQSLVNDNALDAFQVIANTEQALVQAGGTNINWYARYWQGSLTRYYFSDDGTGTTPVKYDAIQFTSLADVYADNVIVFPRGSSEVATGSGIFSYNLDSYSFDTGQAQTLAQYIALVLSVQQAVPSTISTLLNTATSSSALNAVDPGSLLTVKFRGDQYNMIVEGFTLTADPSATRVTYNVSSGEYYNFFILDDAVFGRLDLNKLGL